MQAFRTTSTSYASLRLCHRGQSLFARNWRWTDHPTATTRNLGATRAMAHPTNPSTACATARNLASSRSGHPADLLSAGNFGSTGTVAHAANSSPAAATTQRRSPAGSEPAYLLSARNLRASRAVADTADLSSASRRGWTASRHLGRWTAAGAYPADLSATRNSSRLETRAADLHPTGLARSSHPPHRPASAWKRGQARGIGELGSQDGLERPDRLDRSPSADISRSAHPVLAWADSLTVAPSPAKASRRQVNSPILHKEPPSSGGGSLFYGH